jgi:hypothetical protein
MGRMKYEEAIQSYRSLFTTTINIVWDVLSGLSISYPRGYRQNLSDAIKRVTPPGYYPTSERNFIIEKDDLRQQLSLIWCRTLQRCGDKDKIYIKKQIMRFSIFGMRQWIKEQVRVIRIGPNPIYDSKEFPIKINLKFLTKGTDIFPYCYLTKRDRYELYLHFNNEISINDMVYIVRYRKQNIIDNMRTNFEFLRSNYV